MLVHRRFNDVVEGSTRSSFPGRFSFDVLCCADTCNEQEGRVDSGLPCGSSDTRMDNDGCVHELGTLVCLARSLITLNARTDILLYCNAGVYIAVQHSLETLLIVLHGCKHVKACRHVRRMCCSIGCDAADMAVLRDRLEVAVGDLWAFVVLILVSAVALCAWVAESEGGECGPWPATLPGPTGCFGGVLA